MTHGNPLLEGERDKSGEDTYSSAIASAHRYMSWMLSPFGPYLRGEIVEVGIGHGSYFEVLAPRCSYTGIDIDERSIVAARKRFPAGRFARADILQPGFIDDLLPGKADGILSINVLEHIQDDAAAIRNLVDALKPGGTLMLSVPALMGLYNDLDRLAGHYRRYRLADFERLLAALPVKVEKLCYFNPIGGLGWWLNRFRKHDSLNSDEVNHQIVLFEKYILPFSRALDPVTRTFFGQSVICIARRT
jgi:SAM-dependent methyltransferase